MNAKEKIVHSIIVMIGAFMAILDTTIVDVALPKMIAPLHTDLYGIQWVVTAYMISSAVLLPLIEYIESKVGLKNMFVVGIGLFTSASYMCGTSHRLDEMILFRSVQGAAEALIMVSAQAILFSIFENKGTAMGIFGLGASLAPAAGPTIGGWLTQHIGWEAIFFVNVPVGILNTFLSIFFLKSLKTGKHIEGFNLFSLFFISISTISLIVLLSNGQKWGWFSSNITILFSYLALISFLLYVVFDVYSKDKLIDLSIFSKRNFLMAFFAYFWILGFSMYAVFYALPLFFEKLKGIESFKTGLILLPFAISIAIFSAIGGVLSDKKNPKLVLFISTIIYIGSLYFFLLKFDYYTPKITAELQLIVVGIGLGLFFPPVTVIALSGLEEKMLIVITILDYIRFIGGSFGTAIATNILNTRTDYHFENISMIQSFNAFKIKEFLNSSYLNKPIKEAILYKSIELQAFSEAFQDLFFWCVVFAVVGVLFFAVDLRIKSKA
ncbi:DHA2 family efflux MFS transporter permease subunit [Hydrogenobaculum acidophilum]